MKIISSKLSPLFRIEQNRFLYLQSGALSHLFIMDNIIKHKKTILFILSLLVLAIGINLYSKGNGAKEEHSDNIPTKPPTPVNHLITNSMSDTPQTARFDAAIRRFMRQWNIKGGSFALMRNDSLIYAKGYGYADITDSTECEVKHIFRVASVSKLITAVAIMKLDESGKLSVKDTVFGERGILNDSIFLNTRSRNIKRITVEHLLRHTGGFSNPHGDAAFHPDLVARWLKKELPLSMDDMVEYASKNRLRARPGEWFDYSNMGYIVLSKIIEKASGMPYELYVRDSVLAPAGCYDIHLAQNFASDFRENEVSYYEVKEAELVPAYDGSDTLVMKSLGGNNVRGLYGAGGWVASPVELLKFISAINRCEIREQILSDESIDFMILSDKRHRPAGWSTATSREWHRTGSMAGTSAMIKAQTNGYSWVFISNSSSWTGPKLARQMNGSISRAISRVKEWPKVDLFELSESENTIEYKLSESETGSPSN